MQPDRWRQISQIFKSALTLEPEERVAYVEAQCGADESLRREVELLIESHQKADEKGFINLPAGERAAPLLVQDANEKEERKSRLEKGQEIGHYLVIAKLGAGGMGEVYLARDTRLDRTVALKILPADVASDKRRMLRFKQEAKIASSLNQPNILTIFEFGEADSLDFIATEYIDGETLRHHLSGKQIRLLEIIDIGIQVVAALDAAHEAKIVHRDIKPENIMIRRRDRVVKVLDFGLAKLTEKTPVQSLGQSSDAEAATEALVKTMPGSVLGTVNYMSPEQAQGLAVDERTDIWSIGVVIYEMVAGRAPFSGVTSSHMVVEIIEKEPRLLSQSTQARVPPELERIVSKALAKNADERYQTAKDMLIDLRNLKKRLEVESEIERSAAPETQATSATRDPSFPAQATSDAQLPLTSEQAEGARSYRRRLLLSVSLAAVVVVVALMFGANAWRASRSKVAAPALAAVSERQLSYWMMVQKYRDGQPYEAPFRLAGEINFEKGYQVQLYVSSPQAGYLYILNEGPTAADGLPSYVVLFPSPTANGGSAFLPENRQIQIPEQSWFQFDDEAGTEKLWLVWSANAVPELEAVKQFANPKDKGVINNPVLSQTVKGFLDIHAASKPTVEKKDDQKETNMKAQSDVLLHQLKLEHH